MSGKWKVVKITYRSGKVIYEVQNSVGYPLVHRDSREDAIALARQGNESSTEVVSQEPVDLDES